MRIYGKVKIKATIDDALRLFQRGSNVLAKMEHNGVKFDTQKAKETTKRLHKEIDDVKNEMKKHKDVMDAWQKYATKKRVSINFMSKDQLASVFYGHLGYKCKTKTATGKDAATEKELSQINHPFLRLYRLYNKKQRTINTIQGIVEEVDQYGFVHPNYNLNIAETYRSTCDNPNFQNMQVREKDVAKDVRSLFVSRWSNGQLVENDFKTLEVVVAACYHRDPRMLQNLRNGYDYHRSVAARLFFCKDEEVTKEMRYCAKNMFVFPQFYGSFFSDCTRNIWQYAKKLVFRDKPLLEWLSKKGISKRGKCLKGDDQREWERKHGKRYEVVDGTYEAHVKEVENYFWNTEYPVYTQWKKDWYNLYLQNGHVPLFTGFNCVGNFRRNQVINYSVQGSAFHCLLWTVDRLQSKLRKYKMRTLLIGQIHDCALSDAKHRELQNYLDIVSTTVSVELPKAWDWIIAPMESEAEVCPVGGTWFDKQQFIRKDSGWVLAS